MKRIALIAALCASPAFAQNVTVFVVQKDSSGVIQYESPLSIEDAARQQMAAINMSGQGSNFGPDYSPDQMAPQLEWTQTGTNSWFGSLDMGGSGSSVFLQWGVQVISPTLINNRQELTFAMGNVGSCEVFSFVTAYWVN